MSERRRLDVPCHDLCLNCGWMVPQEPRAKASPESPYRTNAEPRTSSQGEACEVCGDDNWADLREEAVVEQLVLIDDAIGGDPGWLMRGALLAITGLIVTCLDTLAVAAASLAIFVYVRALSYTVMLDLNVGGAAILGAGVFVVSLWGLVGYAVPAFKRVAARSPRKHPIRWSVIDGEVTHAPFTGRPCQGYEVGVCKAGAPPKRPGSWLLQVRCGRVDGPMRRVQLDPSDDRVADYLRRCGVDPLGMDLLFFEAISPM